MFDGCRGVLYIMVMKLDPNSKKTCGGELMKADICLASTSDKNLIPFPKGRDQLVLELF